MKNTVLEQFFFLNRKLGNTLDCFINPGFSVCDVSYKYPLLTARWGMGHETLRSRDASSEAREIIQCQFQDSPTVGFS